jgi:potassium efflux system protein
VRSALVDRSSRFAQSIAAPNAAPVVVPAAWNEAPASTTGNPLREADGQHELHPPEVSRYRPTAPANMPAKNQTPTAPALPPTPSASPEVAVDLPTAEEIKQQLAALEQAPLDEAQRTEISQFLQKAMESLGKAEQAKQKIAQFKAEIEAAPATIEAARQRSSQSLGKPQADAPSDAPVDQLEKIIGDLEAQLAEARKTYEKAVAAADSKLRSERKNEFAARVEAALAKQQQIIDELKAGPLPDELPLRAESRLMSLAVRRETIRHQIASLEAERRREDALAELFPLERDFAQRYAGWLERTVGLWHELLAQRRKAELQQQVIEARNKVQSAIPELRSFAEKNAQFAEQFAHRTARKGSQGTATNQRSA